MKISTLPLFALLLLVLSCDSEKQNESGTSLVTFADSLFSSSIDSAKVAGGSILVFQNGQALLNKSYGYASLELEAPMPTDPTFEIGSVTKQFTAAAILKLDEAGKLSLTDDFTKYLEFDTKGRKVTIGHLLNHTSGIDSYTEIPEFLSLSVQDLPRDTLVSIVESSTFLFEPGEALIYNNSAYFFLGLIIEKVSGKSYEEYLRETFFEPLGMNNTYYCSTSEVRKNKVSGYNFSPEGLQQKPYINHKWPYAAGSLCSTTADLLIWMRALHEMKILSEAQYASLTTPGQLNDGTPLHYAKGLVNFSDNGHQIIAHGGGIHGFLSETRYYPEEDLYIVCLINTTGPHGADHFANAITWKLLEKLPPENVPLDIDADEINGTYAGQTRGQKRTVTIKAIENGVTIQSDQREDTLRAYIGDHTWMDGNNIVVIRNGEYRVDQSYGYYILRKEP